MLFGESVSPPFNPLLLGCACVAHDVEITNALSLRDERGPSASMYPAYMIQFRIIVSWSSPLSTSLRPS